MSGNGRSGIDWEGLIQGLGGKRAGTLQSPAPGTGPTEHDSVATPPTPGFLGGAAIPATKPQTETGYGGSGDPTPAQAPNTITPKRVPPAIPGAMRPRFNTLYDPLRTEGDAWRFVNAGYATGTWTPASSTQLLPVTLVQANAVPSKLYEFAGAISAYWVIQYFSFAPVAVSMTGNQAISFLANNSNNPVALGVYTGNVGGVNNATTLVDAPFTDPTQTAIGNLQVIGNAIATPAVCTWHMNIGIAYLLPPALFSMYTSDADASKQQEAVHRRG